MGRPRPVSARVLPGAEKERLSPGVGALLRGGNGGNGTPGPEAQKAVGSNLSGKRRLVQLSLVLADILLLLAATDILLRQQSSLGTTEKVLCIACVCLGACLSCLALWLQEP